MPYFRFNISRQGIKCFVQNRWYKGVGDYKPYRAFGFFLEIYNQQRVDRIAKEYGDNWLSRSLEGKKLPVRRLQLYFWEWGKCVDL